jgi:pyruvate carboxylase subunit B
MRPADLLDDEMDKLRAAIGTLAGSEEDVLTYAMFPEIGKDFLTQRQAGTLTPEPLEATPSPGESKERRARPTEFNVTLHGETYHVKITGTGHRTQDDRPFYMTVDGVPEEVLVETLDEIPGEGDAARKSGNLKGSKRPRATLPGHVTTSMPGTIIEVLVATDDAVEAGTPLLITEAMKMETEIQAPIAGTVKAINVAKGDSVNPDETLIEIEPAG